MSGTTLKTVVDSRPGAQEYATTQQLNLVMAALDGVLAKLDLDAGVTDVNYASLWGTGYAKVGTKAGTVI